MGADFTTFRFLNASLVQTADGDVKDLLVRGEGQAVGVLTLVASQVNLTIKSHAEDAWEPQFALLRGYVQLWIGEVDAAVRAADYVVGPVHNGPSVGPPAVTRLGSADSRISDRSSGMTDSLGPR